MKNAIKKLNNLIGRYQHVWIVTIFVGFFMLCSYSVFEDLIISIYCDLIFFSMLLCAFVLSLLLDLAKVIYHYLKKFKNKK